MLLQVQSVLTVTRSLVVQLSHAGTVVHVAFNKPNLK